MDRTVKNTKTKKGEIMMKTCSNCQTQFEGNVCPTCGAPESTPTQKEIPVLSPELPLEKKGRISAVIRLLLMTICNVSSVVVLFYGMFRPSDMTVGEKIVDAFDSFAMIVFLGVWLWGFVKWLVFATPKTVRFAKKIVHTVIPLSFYAGAIELMVVVILAVLPFWLYTATFAPVLFLMDLIQNDPTYVGIAFVLLAVSGLGSYFLGRMDFRHVFGRQKLRNQDE